MERNKTESKVRTSRIRLVGLVVVVGLLLAATVWCLWSALFLASGQDALASPQWRVAPVRLLAPTWYRERLVASCRSGNRCAWLLNVHAGSYEPNLSTARPCGRCPFAFLPMNDVFYVSSTLCDEALGHGQSGLRPAGMTCAVAVRASFHLGTLAEYASSTPLREECSQHPATRLDGPSGPLWLPRGIGPRTCDMLLQADLAERARQSVLEIDPGLRRRTSAAAACSLSLARSNRWFMQTATRLECGLVVDPRHAFGPMTTLERRELLRWLWLQRLQHAPLSLTSTSFLTYEF